jgi:hypothetical protein
MKKVVPLFKYFTTICYFKFLKFEKVHFGSNEVWMILNLFKIIWILVWTTCQPHRTPLSPQPPPASAGTNRCRRRGPPLAQARVAPAPSSSLHSASWIRPPPPPISSPWSRLSSPLYRLWVAATVPLSPCANPLTKGLHRTPPHPRRPPVRASHQTAVSPARFWTPTATIVVSKVSSTVPSV